MGKSGNLGEAKGAGSALDGVGSPEDGVDFFNIGGLVEIQQAGFEDIKPLKAFLKKDILYF